MLTNYFKVAYRNLIRNKVFSFINISGLAFGACHTDCCSWIIWTGLLFH